MQVCTVTMKGHKNNRCSHLHDDTLINDIVASESHKMASFTNVTLSHSPQTQIISHSHTLTPSFSQSQSKTLTVTHSRNLSHSRTGQWTPVTEHRPHTTDHSPQNTGHIPQTIGHTPQTSQHRLQTTDHTTTDHRPQCECDSVKVKELDSADQEEQPTV